MPKSPESEKKNKSPEAEKSSKAPTPDREKINKIEKISKLLTPSEPPKIEIEKVKEACRGWSMDTAPDKGKKRANVLMTGAPLEQVGRV